MRRYVRPRRDPGKTAIMVMIAASMMIFVDQVILNPSPSTSARLASYKAVIESPNEGAELSAAHEVVAYALPEGGPQSFPATDSAAYKVPDVMRRDQWRQSSAAVPQSTGKAKIVIIIDDLGLSEKASKEISALPGPLTLSYLPYGRNLPKLTKQARKSGHELMIHTPMEAVSDKANPGPMALMDGMSDADIEATMARVFDSFDGYVGINNHMGSKLTQNRAAMDAVMRQLQKRGLIFVDSRTIGNSVASEAARAAGLYYARRDVFLDHESTRDFVKESLAHLEQVAQDKGYAIAIGHPNKATISVLKEWLPTLEARGFALVPVSDVVRSDVMIAEDSDAAALAGIEPAAGEEEAVFAGPMSEMPVLLQSLPRE